MSETVTVEIENPEVAEYIGHSLVENGRNLKDSSNDNIMLSIYLVSIGRNIIEESRAIRKEGGEEVFEDSLFTVE